MHWIDWLRLVDQYERIGREIAEKEEERANEPTVIYKGWTDEDGKHHYERFDVSAQVAEKYEYILPPLYEKRRELGELIRSTQNEVLRTLECKIAEIEAKERDLRDQIFELGVRESDLRYAIRSFPSWREVPVLPQRDALVEELNRVIAERKKLEELKRDLPKHEELDMLDYYAKKVRKWRG